MSRKYFVATPCALLASLAALLSVPTAAQQFERPTPEQLWHLPFVGQDEALARGFTGRGFTIGIVDRAVEISHPEFAGRWSGAFDIYGGPYSPRFHGTHVAGIAAGAHVGVAPGASLFGVNIFDGSGNFDALIGDGYRAGLASGVRAFNNSWQFVLYDPFTRTYSTADATRETLETDHPRLLGAYEDVAAAGAVQVFGTGNSRLAQPSWLAGLPHFFPELQPYWLAVTAVGPTGRLASYANACGVAAQWCLAAPGGDGDPMSDDAIWSAWTFGRYASIDGTSMATPVVTGALAVAAEVFPRATTPELVRLLLETASDIGAPGVDAIYGWGLINLDNVVEAIAPRTARVFSSASWSRFATLRHVGAAIPPPRLGAGPTSGGSRGGRAAYASFGAHGEGGSMALRSTGPQSVWTSVLSGRSDLAGTAPAPGIESSTAGVLIGADVLAGPSYRVGAAAGLSWTDLDGGAGDGAETRGAHLLVYGDWAQDGWFASASGQMAFLDQTIVRVRIAGAQGTAATPIGRSSVSSTGAALRLRAGYGWTVQGVEVSPYLAAAMLWQRTGAFAETGAGVFSLAVAEAAEVQHELGPGLRLSAPPLVLDRFAARASLDVSYARLAGDRAHETSARLLGAAIASRSTEAGADVIAIGADIELIGHGGRSSGVLSYAGRFQGNTTLHTVQAGLSLAF